MTQEKALLLVRRAVLAYRAKHEVRELIKVRELGFDWDKTKVTSTITDPELQTLVDNILNWIHHVPLNLHKNPDYGVVCQTK